MPLALLREEPSTVSDAALVARARDDERWARGELYNRHADFLAAYLARLLGDRDEALDVMHDAYVYAFRRLDDLRQPARFRSWLFRIATSGARTRMRRRRFLRYVGLAGEGDVPWDVLAQAASAEARVELRQLENALRKRSIDEQIVWVLHEVEGATLAETAEQSGLSLATVKRKLRRARLSLQGVDDD